MTERKRERERERESKRKCEDTSSGQSGSRNIFENLNRLLETTGPARRRVRVDTGEVEGSRPEGRGGEDERRRGKAFSRGYSR